MSEPVRIAIVGLGYWGPNYARAVAELEDAELRWCCDLQPSLLELPARRYPSVRLTTDLDDVLSDEDVDAVIVATPTRTHADLTIAALRAGKDVLVEKPLAASLEECERVRDAVDGNVLMVGHTFVYNPAVVALRDLVRRDELGALRYVSSIRAGLGPIRQDVNALWDLAPHDIAILLELASSRPLLVNAVGQGYLSEEREDVVYLHVTFEDGVTAHAHLSWLEPYKVRRTTVVGEQKMAVFDDMANDERLKILDRGADYQAQSERARGSSYGEYRAVVREGDVVIPRLARSEPLAEQLVEFVSAVRDRRPAYSGFEAGRDVVAVLEAATASLRSAGAPQQVALEPRVEIPA
jgi:predicted dehydrogenase